MSRFGLFPAPAVPHRGEFDVLEHGATGDGSTDDTAAFQDAIDAAEANGGGVVVVPAGDYLLEDPGTDFCLQVLADDITIDVHGGATLQIADAQVAGSEILNIIRVGDGTTAVSGFRLTGSGRLDGNRANQTGAGSTPAGALVRIEGPVTDALIDVASIVSSRNGGVFINGESAVSRAERVTIRGVHFDDHNGDGVVWQQADTVIVEGNRFTNQVGQDCIEPSHNTNGWVIRNNTIVGAASTAIDVFAQTGPDEDGLVEGNYIEGGGGAVDLRVASGATAPVRRIVVRDNILVDADGIDVGSTDVVEDITIEGNVIVRGDGDGIQADAGVVGLKVIGNTVRECGEDGIQLAAGLSDALVAFNHCYNNGQDGTGGATEGIRANNTVDCRFVGNYCIDDQGVATQGIGLTIIGADRPVVRDNHFAGNTTAPIDAQSATDPIFRANSGVVDQERGTATVPSGSTSVEVRTSVTFRIADNSPEVLTLADIRVVPTNDLGNASKWWIETLGLTSGDRTFEIHVDADPGAGGATFTYELSVGA